MEHEDEQLVTSGLLATERRILRKQRILMMASTNMDIALAGEFIEDMLILSSEGKEPISIVICSPGGQLEAGLACIEAIRMVQNKGIEVSGRVFGHAESMAFFVLQACDYRIMGKGDWLMAHGLRMFQEGDQKNRKIEDDMLTKTRRHMAEMIASRNTSADVHYRNPEHWFDMFEDMTPNYYNAEESFRAGLIDMVEDGFLKEKE